MMSEDEVVGIPKISKKLPILSLILVLLSLGMCISLLISISHSSYWYWGSIDPSKITYIMDELGWKIFTLIFTLIWIPLLTSTTLTVIQYKKLKLFIKKSRMLKSLLIITTVLIVIAVTLNIFSALHIGIRGSDLQIWNYEQ